MVDLMKREGSSLITCFRGHRKPLMLGSKVMNMEIYLHIHFDTFFLLLFLHTHTHTHTHTNTYLKTHKQTDTQSMSIFLLHCTNSRKKVGRTEQSLLK